MKNKTLTLTLKKDGYFFSCNTMENGQHYKCLMRLGRIFPSTRAQANFFVSEGVLLDVLNGDDVEKVESLLNKHGFEGNYKSTKSKIWGRLQNHKDLQKALKLEFNI